MSDEGINQSQLKQIVEAAILAASEPLSIKQIANLFDDEERPENNEIKGVIELISHDCDERGIELKEVGSGYRFQAKESMTPWIRQLWDERPPKYSRAYLETLALIAYRQPITRAEIEEVRGVAVSTNIMKTLVERGWVKRVGHRDVPGKPGLYGTTKIFLDYFNLTSLGDLPTLTELQDLDALEEKLGIQLKLDMQEVAEDLKEETPVESNESSGEVQVTEEDEEPVQTADILVHPAMQETKELEPA